MSHFAVFRFIGSFYQQGNCEENDKKDAEEHGDWDKYGNFRAKAEYGSNIL